MKVFFLFLFVICSENLLGQNNHLLNQLVKNKHLIALWDFKEAKGDKRKSLLGPYELSEMDGQIEREDEGPLSGYSAKFGHGAYLSLPNNQTGFLLFICRILLLVHPAPSSGVSPKKENTRLPKPNLTCGLPTVPLGRDASMPCAKRC